MTYEEFYKAILDDTLIVSISQDSFSRLNHPNLKEIPWMAFRKFPKGNPHFYIGKGSFDFMSTSSEEMATYLVTVLELDR